MDSDISRVRDDQQSSLTDAAFALIRELRSSEAGDVKSDVEVLEALKELQKDMEDKKS